MYARLQQVTEAVDALAYLVSRHIFQTRVKPAKKKNHREWAATGGVYDRIAALRSLKALMPRWLTKDLQKVLGTKDPEVIDLYLSACLEGAVVRSKQDAAALKRRKP